MFLVHHAATDDAGVRLSGRLPGLRLNHAGVEQALALAGRLQSLAPAAIYSSPLERALETAAPIARTCGVKITIEPDLVEIDFGAWTGAPFDRLATDDGWQLFNERPGRARIPGGERVAEVADRAARVVQRLARRHNGLRVIAVSHADVLRLGIARLLGRPLDSFRSLDIPPAGFFSIRFSGEHIAEAPWPDAVAVHRQAS
jgi:probable phosphoglycerate mutase